MGTIRGPRWARSPRHEAFAAVPPQGHAPRRSDRTWDRAAARTHHPRRRAAHARLRARCAACRLDALSMLLPRRAAHDALAAEHAFRYIPGVTPRARGGEDALLLERREMHLDPGSQLVDLCEVCGRPSTRLSRAACASATCAEETPDGRGAAGYLHYLRRSTPPGHLTVARSPSASSLTNSLCCRADGSSLRVRLQTLNFRTDDELLMRSTTHRSPLRLPISPVRGHHTCRG